MKVLWFSNCIITDEKTKSTGTWLFTMASSLVSQGLDLFNITQSNRIKNIESCSSFLKGQWVLPSYKLYNGLPSLENIKKIKAIVDEISPDIIHIWGMEGYWGLLSARGHVKGNILLEIQGICHSCVDAFLGGLSLKDQIACFKLKEFIKPSLSIWGTQRTFQRWGYYEKEMLGTHQFISTQSDWVRSWISPDVCSSAYIFKTLISVREEFLKGRKWTCCNSSEPTLMCVSSCVSYKGVHVVLRALSVLKEKYPTIKLKIAGNFDYNRPSYRVSGYMKFLRGLIKKLNLDRNVSFLGPLNSEQLVEEAYSCNVMIHSSFVESYSLALAESMALGVPSVISYAGAMTELAKDNITGLFYKSDDYHQCAGQIVRLLEDRVLAEKISQNAMVLGRKRNSSEIAAKKQMEIYDHVLSLSCLYNKKL